MAEERLGLGPPAPAPPDMQLSEGEVDGPIASIVGGFLALSAGLSGDVNVDR